MQTTNHVVDIADTQLEFAIQKSFTPDNPFQESIYFKFKLNGSVFDSTYTPNEWDTYEETFKAIVARILNIMLSRTAYPIFQRTVNATRP